MHCRELDDEISANLEDVCIRCDKVCRKKCNVLECVCLAEITRLLIINHFLYIWGFQQEEITEDDIDDSFKSMFAQLAGEVTLVLANT